MMVTGVGKNLCPLITNLFSGPVGPVSASHLEYYGSDFCQPVRSPLVGKANTAETRPRLVAHDPTAIVSDDIRRPMDVSVDQHRDRAAG